MIIKNPVFKAGRAAGRGCGTWALAAGPGRMRPGPCREVAEWSVRYRRGAHRQMQSQNKPVGFGPGKNFQFVVESAGSQGFPETR